MKDRRNTGAGGSMAWRHVRAIAALPFTNTVIIPFALLAATGGFDTALPSPATAARIAAFLFGVGLTAVGLVLVVHAISLFARAGQGTLAPWDPTRFIVIGGAYRYTRNPMKTGLFLVLLGEAALLRSPALLGWFALFAVANVLYIPLAEEPGLRRRFGAQYDEYCARVPRWVPRLGRRDGRSSHRDFA